MCSNKSQWLSQSAGEHKPLADTQNSDVQVKHILLNAQCHFKNVCLCWGIPNTYFIIPVSNSFFVIEPHHDFTCSKALFLLLRTGRL